jgi:hypothetical protein
MIQTRGKKPIDFQALIGSLFSVISSLTYREVF